MKDLVLNIEEGKYEAFLHFIKTLDFVKISQQNQEIPTWQKNIVNERISEYENGKLLTRKWEDAQADIFKK